MKIKHPEFVEFGQDVTPDYSPRTPCVVLPNLVRERGRQLTNRRAVAVVREYVGISHTLLKSQYHFADGHRIESTEPVNEPFWNAPNPIAIEVGKHSAKSQITATLGEIKQGKPRSVAMDELDWELLDDLEFGEIPPKASFPIQLRVTKIERGQIDSVAIDDSVLEYFDI